MLSKPINKLSSKQNTSSTDYHCLLSQYFYRGSANNQIPYNVPAANQSPQGSSISITSSEHEDGNMFFVEENSTELGEQRETAVSNDSISKFINFSSFHSANPSSDNIKHANKIICQSTAEAEIISFVVCIETVSEKKKKREKNIKTTTPNVNSAKKYLWNNILKLIYNELKTNTSQGNKRKLRKKTWFVLNELKTFEAKLLQDSSFLDFCKWAVKPENKIKPCTFCRFMLKKDKGKFEVVLEKIIESFFLQEGKLDFYIENSGQYKNCSENNKIDIIKACREKWETKILKPKGLKT